MIFRFDEFEVDLRLYELRRAGSRCPLEPQVFDLLAYLVQNSDRLVTKDELIERIWPERYISDAAISSRVMAARKALGDTGRDQRYIRTVHGRGFRFIGKVQQAASAPVVQGAGAVAAPAPVAGLEGRAPVGRESELELLSQCYTRALSGQRRVVFVTGESGAGKSTLVEAFLGWARERGPAWIGYGQCLEHLGTGEAYLPVLDALGRLCRGEDGETLVQLLRRTGPTWLAQLPWLLDDDDLQAVQQRVTGATKERMLREMMETLEAMAAAKPVVLVLEDLHWTDYSTLDVLSLAARRQEPARLLVIGTYRPADVRQTGHPLDDLQHDLRIRGQCQELRLPYLTEDAVEVYLGRRFPGADIPPRLAALLAQRTGGNPLFMTSVADAWAAEGLVSQVDGAWRFVGGTEELARHLPDNLRQVIERQFDRVSETERALLEAASVIGQEFGTAGAAAGAEVNGEEADAAFDRLARRGSLVESRGVEEWPDGTLSARYAFVHSLYQEAMYDRLPPTRRVRLHQRVGERLEAGYGQRVRERAVELAHHFVRGRSTEKALRYLRMAARSAQERDAHREALEHLATALGLVEQLDEAERVPAEVSLLAMHANSLLATEGFGSEAAQRAFSRALELAQKLDDPETATRVIFGLAVALEFRSDHQTAETLLRSVETASLGDLELSSYYALMACSLFHQGDFDRAVKHGLRALEAVDPAATLHTGMAVMGEDPVLAGHQWSSLALWFLGRPDQALERVTSVLELARAPKRDYSVASANTHTARIHQFRREPELVRERAEEALAVAEPRGYAYHVAVGHIMRGWARAVQGEDGDAVQELREGIEVHSLTGARMDRPYYLGMLADAERHAGRFEEALRAIDEALAGVGDGQPFFYEAELHRIRGDILLALGKDTDAEKCFRRALEVARAQQSLAVELRASLSLARLLLDSGKPAGDAVASLAQAYGRFEEGFDTRDLVEARAFLAAQPAAAPSG